MKYFSDHALACKGPIVLSKAALDTLPKYRDAQVCGVFDSNSPLWVAGFVSSNRRFEFGVLRATKEAQAV